MKKTFKDFLIEAKAYNKKGRMYVYKEPVFIRDIDTDKGLYIIAVGLDVNGNPLMRVEINGKKISRQIDYGTTRRVDDVVNGLSDSQIKAVFSLFRDKL